MVILIYNISSLSFYYVNNICRLLVSRDSVIFSGQRNPLEMTRLLFAAGAGAEPKGAVGDLDPTGAAGASNPPRAAAGVIDPNRAPSAEVVEPEGAGVDPGAAAGVDPTAIAEADAAGAVAPKAGAAGAGVLKPNVKGGAAWMGAGAAGAGVDPKTHPDCCRWLFPAGPSGLG